MHNTDMHHAYIKALILLIGGRQMPNENVKGYLARVSRATGVGYSSLRQAYYGRWISKNQFVSNETLQKLEQAAKNARQTADCISFIELQIAIWETAPELFQPHIDLSREFTARLRACDDEIREMDRESAAERRAAGVSARRTDAATAATAAGFAASAAAVKS